MSMPVKPHPKAASSYISIGDPYVKVEKDSKETRVKGKQMLTTIPKAGQIEGYFTQMTYAPEPFSDETLKYANRRKATGFLSSDANRRDEFTHTLRTNQLRERTHREQQVAARANARTQALGLTTESLSDRRDVLEELEEQYERNLRDPHLFQTKVPTLYDIGKPNGAGVTVFCNKCSKDTFYCVHRVGNGHINARRLGPARLLSQDIGSGDVLNVNKPQYGLKGNLNTFYDLSHLTTSEQ